jgi:hypothetical protein
MPGEELRQAKDGDNFLRERLEGNIPVSGTLDRFVEFIRALSGHRFINLDMAGQPMEIAKALGVRELRRKDGPEFSVFDHARQSRLSEKVPAEDPRCSGHLPCSRTAGRRCVLLALRRPRCGLVDEVTIDDTVLGILCASCCGGRQKLQ